MGHCRKIGLAEHAVHAWIPEQGRPIGPRDQPAGEDLKGFAISADRAEQFYDCDVFLVARECKEQLDGASNLASLSPEAIA